MANTRAETMSSTNASLSRRALLEGAGTSLLFVPLGAIAGCTAALPSGHGATGGSWATGGTRAIGASARFPDPFTSDLSQACRLTCMTTIGPCHTVSPERGDLSDGWDGLPLRLALRVVDSACKPVEGAIVELWHTNYTGGYSGEIVAMCNNNRDDLAKGFFRGYQRSDASGIVHFDSCYPGWYRGRAVHIHLRVMMGDYLADDRAPSSVTTQLLFTDALNEEIFSSHPLYRPFGQPDTTLASDNVVGGESDFAPYLFEVRRMPDGVVFASKTLIVRQSDEEAVCQARGAGGPGGPPGGPERRGPPPEGFGSPQGDRPRDR
ncbi:MAG: hypothetical protein QM676_01915 [Novosphingobium sp.]